MERLLNVRHDTDTCTSEYVALLSDDNLARTPVPSIECLVSNAGRSVHREIAERMYYRLLDYCLHAPLARWIQDQKYVGACFAHLARQGLKFGADANHLVPRLFSYLTSASANPHLAVDFCLHIGSGCAEFGMIGGSPVKDWVLSRLKELRGSDADVLVAAGYPTIYCELFRAELRRVVDGLRGEPLEGFERLIERFYGHASFFDDAFTIALLSDCERLIKHQLQYVDCASIPVEALRQTERLLLLSGNVFLAETIRRQTPGIRLFRLPHLVWNSELRWPMERRRLILDYWRSLGSRLNYNDIGNAFSQVIKHAPECIDSLGWDPQAAFLSQMIWLDWTHQRTSAQTLACNLIGLYGERGDIPVTVRHAVSEWLEKHPSFISGEFAVLRAGLLDGGRPRFRPGISFADSGSNAAESIVWDEFGIDEVIRQIKQVPAEQFSSKNVYDWPIPGLPVSAFARGLIDQEQFGLLIRLVERSQSELAPGMHARLLVEVLGVPLYNSRQWETVKANVPIGHWCAQFALHAPCLPIHFVHRVYANLGYLINRQGKDFIIGEHIATRYVQQLERLATAATAVATGFDQTSNFNGFVASLCNSSALFRLLNASNGTPKIGAPGLEDLKRWLAVLPNNLSTLYSHQLLLVTRATALAQQMDLESIRRRTRSALTTHDGYDARIEELNRVRGRIVDHVRALRRLLPPALRGKHTQSQLQRAAEALPWYRRLWYALRIYQAQQRCASLAQLQDRQLGLRAALNRTRAAAYHETIQHFLRAEPLAFTPSIAGIWLLAYCKWAGAEWELLSLDRFEPFLEQTKRDSRIPGSQPVATVRFKYHDSSGVSHDMSFLQGGSMPLAWRRWLSMLIGERECEALAASGLFEPFAFALGAGPAIRTEEIAVLQREVLRTATARIRFAAQLAGDSADLANSPEYRDTITDLLCGLGDARFSRDVSTSLNLALPSASASDSEWASKRLTHELVGALSKVAECLTPAEHNILSGRIDAWQRQWDSAAGIEAVTSVATEWQLLEQQRGLLTNLAGASEAQLQGALFDTQQQAWLDQRFSPLFSHGAGAEALMHTWSPLEEWLDQVDQSLGRVELFSIEAGFERLARSSCQHLIQFYIGKQADLYALVLSRDVAARQRLRQTWPRSFPPIVEESNLSQFRFEKKPEIETWLAALRSDPCVVVDAVSNRLNDACGAAWFIDICEFLKAAQPAAVVFSPELAIFPWESFLPPGCISRFAAVSHFFREADAAPVTNEMVFQSSAINMLADEAERRVIEDVRAGQMRSIDPAGVRAQLVTSAKHARAAVTNAWAAVTEWRVPPKDVAGDASAPQAGRDPLSRVLLAKQISESRWTHLVLHGRAEVRQEGGDPAGGELSGIAGAPRVVDCRATVEQVLCGPSLEIGGANRELSSGQSQSVRGSETAGLSTNNSGQDLPAWFLASLRLPGSGVFLSSCEAGLMLPAKLRAGGAALPDSLSWFGVAPAFAAAGANLVIAPLWRVKQLPNFLFVRAFYGHAVDHPESSVAAALAAARRFVKSITVDEIRRWLELYEPEDRKRRKWLLEDCGLSLKSAGDVRPFASPYYWAGYVALGDSAVSLRTLFGRTIHNEALTRRH